jgi:tRNA dimethylallyltransferase
VEQEVANVLPRLGQSAGQAIGLKAVSEVLEGKSSPENAIQTIIHATRQYARRQETWFRKEPGLHPQSPENALAFCMHLLKRRSH